MVMNRLQLILTLVLTLGFLVTPGLGLSRDGILLLALKKSVWGDPTGALCTWKANDSTPCHWHGVNCNAARVASVNVAYRNLSGTIPPELGGLDYMHRLGLSGNRLSGAIPPDLFNATNLRTLLLSGNRLVGAVPAVGIAHLAKLENLDLSDNRLVGEVPAGIANCRSLRQLNLAGNSFSGAIPVWLGNLSSLHSLDLSANRLYGTIPSEFGNLSNLEGTLNLSFNHLSGAIPATLGNLRYIVGLDLSHNNLSGRIPQDGSLADQGPGPFLDNPNLCGFPLGNSCPTTTTTTPPGGDDSPLPGLPTDGMPSGEDNTPVTWGPTGAMSSPDLNPGAIVAIAIGDALGVTTVALLFLYLYWKTTACHNKLFFQRGGDSNNESDNFTSSSSSSSNKKIENITNTNKEKGELVPLDKSFAFSLEELLQASACILGKTGLGIVYKVVLGNGLPLVVRRLGEVGSQRFREFETEAQAIGRICHPNLVKLRAYYWAEDEKLLIYNYIPNGTLSSVLHGDCSVLSPGRALPWLARLRIAQGLARGLAYLHDCSPRKYVHGDIRPSKVLLDVEMNPHIADFGLSRLAGLAQQAFTPPNGNSSILGSALSSPYSPSITGMGLNLHSKTIKPKTSSSFYYRAPEYTTGSKPTQKGDVYSFGVVLLELLTGRLPSFQEASFGISLPLWMRKAAEEEKPLSQTLDPSLLVDTESDKDIASVIRIALACTESIPDHRPKMKFVSDSLDKVGHP